MLFTSQHSSGFRARVFPHFAEKKELFGAGYPLVWYIVTVLQQLFTTESVNSGGYLRRRFAARQISTTIHFHLGKSL